MKYTVEVSHGCTSWYKEDTNILHREDGPAVEYSDGRKYWYLNGEKHREDGPAIVYSYGHKYWYLNDINYTEQEFNKIMAKKNNSCSGKIVEIDGKKYKLIEV
jgi:hypothetical protein